jgi:hypothetical protein
MEETQEGTKYITINEWMKNRRLTLSERWKLDREMWIIDEVEQPDGTVVEVERSLCINGWEKTADGKWLNRELGILDD